MVYPVTGVRASEKLPQQPAETGNGPGVAGGFHHRPEHALVAAQNGHLQLPFEFIEDFRCPQGGARDKNCIRPVEAYINFVQRWII